MIRIRCLVNGSSKTRLFGFSYVFGVMQDSLLLPLMLISRLRSRTQKEKFDPGGELKVNPVLNKSLECILSFERLFIKAGVSFPFGGSLLLVGRKV